MGSTRHGTARPYPMTHDSVNCTMKSVSAQPWYAIACKKHSPALRGGNAVIHSKTRNKPPMPAFMSQQEKTNQNPPRGVTPWGWGSKAAHGGITSNPQKQPAPILEKMGNNSPTSGP